MFQVIFHLADAFFCMSTLQNSSRCNGISILKYFYHKMLLSNVLSNYFSCLLFRETSFFYYKVVTKNITIYALGQFDSKAATSNILLFPF